MTSAQLTKEGVLDALRSIKDTSTDRDIVALDLVKKCAVCDGFVSIAVACVDDKQTREGLREAITHRVTSMGGERSKLSIDFMKPEKPTTTHDRSVPLKQAASSKTTSAGSAQAGSSSLPDVKHIIAVGAGKGGVGKSTISVNLAVGLARQGHTVGLLDGDIYGPSAPTLLGLDNLDTQVRGNMLQVFYVHGIKSMTIGKLVDPEKPLIWRGPMAHGAFKQLVEQTEWGALDYLIIDLPPGTGDVPLTMAQMLSLTGAVVVCTPQKVAQDDAVRAVRMFQQLQVPVLGIVENMSYFIGDDGKEYDIFGRGGAEMMAQRMGLPFLGSVPINMKLRQHSDSGEPTRNFTDAGDALCESLEKMTQNIERQAAIAGMHKSKVTPTLTVS
ncbi:MAG: Mrp/NBP35 family ATP-binding protein [Phycisphaerales bacterium]